MRGWFVSGVLFSPTRLGQLLSDFYKCGGLFLSPSAVQAAQWTCGLLTAGATIAFIVNAVSLSRRGQPPSRLKLLLLVTSIGFWWYAMIAVNNAILGVAMFEISTMCSTWRSCGISIAAARKSTPTAGPLTRFLFRGGGVMLGLYLGLVFAYGALGLLPRIIDADAVNRVLGAVFVTSGLLHFYYDGFIWKVRERATRDGLGLQSSSPTESWLLPRGITHAVKWIPFALAVGWFGWARAHGVAPATDRMQQVVAAVPNAWMTQLQLGVEWMKQNDPARAVPALEAAVLHAPRYADAHYRLGNALAKLGRDEEAMKSLTPPRNSTRTCPTPRSIWPCCSPATTCPAPPKTITGRRCATIRSTSRRSTIWAHCWPPPASLTKPRRTSRPPSASIRRTPSRSSISATCGCASSAGMTHRNCSRALELDPQNAECAPESGRRVCAAGST